MPATEIDLDREVALRAASLLEEHQRLLHRRTDRLFAGLMALQWLAGLAAARWITPRTWAGASSETHPHVWDALFLGGLVTLLPVALALWRPGRELTRHVIAIGQLVMSGLLIHFTGGRAETHFHIFGSLAFLAFYRDWRVLITASVVTAADHYLRGVFWPQSLYGTAAVEPWRWLEHAGWVVFEDTFLIISCAQSTREMRDIACRRARHEADEERMREREASLLRANAVLRAQQEAGPDGLLVVDERRRVVSYNRRFREMWDVPGGPAEGSRALLDHCAAQVRDPDALRAEVGHLDDHPWESGRGELLLTDGRIFDRFTGPVVGEDGTHYGRVWYVRDVTKHVQAERTLERRVEERTAALARAGHQNQALLDAAGEGIYGLDADGLTTFINPAAAQMLGYTSDELRGQPMHALLHHTLPDGAPYSREDCPIYAALRDGTVYHVADEVFWRKDGTAFPVDYTATPVREEGRIVGAVVVFQDITESRRTQEQLAHALQERENIMETVPDILFRLDLGGRLVQWNRKMETVTGLAPEALQGMAAVELFPAPDRDKAAQAIGAAFQSGYAEYEGDFLGAGGAPVPYQFSGVPLRDPAGRVIGLTGVGRDVTERRRADAALRASEQRYRGLLDDSPEGVAVYCEGRFVYANRAAQALLGASGPEGLLGRPVLDVVHPDFHALARERARRTQEEGRPSPLAQQRYVRLDGTAVDVEAVTSAVTWEGKPAGQVLIRDITERLRAEAQITRLNAQLEQRLDSIEALNAELSHAYDATIAGWSRALDLRDHETEGHSLRVTDLTLRLAEAFGIAGDARTHLQRGALLHDIGKMGVPDAVLNKPGPLTDDERAVMCLHPAYAHEMLSGIPFVHPALDIPYCHHEKWDGTGYPRGLAGEEIPLSARLFAVVDVWDALRSDRPYRRAWPVGRTRAHIASLSGTHFDPQVVDVFLSRVAPALPDAPPAPLLRAA